MTFHPPQTYGIGSLLGFKGSVTLRHDLSYGARTIDIVTDAGESASLKIRPTDADARQSITLDVRRNKKILHYVDYVGGESIEVMGNPLFADGSDYPLYPVLEFIDARKDRKEFDFLEKTFLYSVNPVIARTNALIEKFCRPRKSAIQKIELRGDAAKKIFSILRFPAPQKGKDGGRILFAAGANFYHLDVFGPGAAGSRPNAIIVQHYAGAAHGEIYRRNNRVDLIKLVPGNDLGIEESASIVSRVMKELTRVAELSAKPLQKPRDPLLIAGDVVPRPGSTRKPGKAGTKSDTDRPDSEEDGQQSDAERGTKLLRIPQSIKSGPKIY